MKMRALALLAVTLLATSAARAVVIDFEDIASPGSISFLFNFESDGFRFQAGDVGYVIDSASGFGTPFLGNGTDYYAIRSSAIVQMFRQPVGPFSLQSFDATFWDASNQSPFEIEVFGALAAGGSRFVRFATDGLLGFQTFFFDDTWTGLTQVQFRALGPGMAYDNIVVDEPVGVTEPSVLLLVAGGLITLALRRGRQRAHRAGA